MGKTTHSEVELDEVEIPRKKITIFPNNTNNLLPSHYYRKLKAWYEHFSIAPSERSDEENSWIRGFKFNFSCPNSSNRTHFCISFRRQLRGGVATRGETKERAVIMIIIIAVRTVVMVTTIADAGLTATEANILQGPHRWTTTVAGILTAVRLVTVHLKVVVPPPLNRTGKSAPRNYTK